MVKKVSFYTLGCRLNQAETASLSRSFAQQGYQVVDFRDPADVVVVNTCTVTENGDSDTRKVVHKINRINPDSKIALIGCQAQIQKGELLQMPGVYWVVGNARKMELAELIHEPGRDGPTVVAPLIPRHSFTIPVPGIDSRHTRANLKIQDGCDFFCSFCEIPYARGRARSRDFGDLFKEARALVRAGHKELVLTGINIGTYRFQNRSFVDVIAGLESLPGLHRIRISSIELTTIPSHLLPRMSRNGKLCRYLHVPLQSGSNEILTEMNRRYTVEDFQLFVLQAHRTIPHLCLGTDVIVGFPGETESHFAATEEVLRELPLTYFHVFSYSDRNRARSRKLGNKVAPEIIEKRSRRLRELSGRKRRAYFEQLLGQTTGVLFEQRKNGCWNGLTDTYVRVKVRSNLSLQNRLLPVRLEGIEGQMMTGTLR